MSKTTRRVRVAHGEQLDIVGELVFETDGRRETSLFRYAAEWLENPQRFAIAPTMPLSGGPFHQSAFGTNRRTARPVALLKRFDRAGDGSRICYLSAQSFVGAETATDAFYTDIADALRTHAFAPVTQLAELFRRILFTILVSNNDDHLKNHGLLLISESIGSKRAGEHRSQGRWALAPAFDINPQPQRHRRLETGISELSGNAASVEAALEAAPFFDIHQDAATAMLAQMSAVLAAQWQPCCRRAGMTTAEIKRCAPAFEHEEHRVARRLTRGIGKA